MSSSRSYFFCGIGGSGMNPLAVFLSQRGWRITGSDRGRDQGNTPDKFTKLEQSGITLFPQDGSGVTERIDAVVVSSAVEETIPDVARARALGIPVRKRAEILADLYREYRLGISIGGTSGKSTVTGMIATILEQAGRDPSVMNGGVIRNFAAAQRMGGTDIFVAEMDESDGSIALFDPGIAVLNNIALDHKSIEELEQLFTGFVAKATRGAVLNFDDARVKALRGKAKTSVLSYGIRDADAQITARDIALKPDGAAFYIRDSETGHQAAVRLRVPGMHNISNALAAIAASMMAGLTLAEAAAGLDAFTGIRRRLEVTGTRNGVTVIDDFGHNPDKIAASLATLKEFDGRLIVMFQPHGFGPLKLMGREIVESFAHYMSKGDIVIMPEVYYAGGTADKSVTAKDIVALMKEKNLDAHWFAARDEILPFIRENARAGDRVIVMGARDDTLSAFAESILGLF